MKEIHHPEMAVWEPENYGPSLPGWCWLLIVIGLITSLTGLFVLVSLFL